MLAWIGRAFDKMVSAILTTIGTLVVLVLVLWGYSDLKAWWKADKPVEGNAAQVVAQPVADAVPADVSCACSNGQWCQGPQGGIYCMTAEGKKRYRAK